MLKPYLTEIVELEGGGDAREESFYPALKSLLTEFSNSTNRKEIHITVLPKKTDAGNPDFRIWDGKRKIVGYIDAKVLKKNLDEVEKTEQFSRYSATFPNFIVTNFIEFRLYKTGSRVGEARISKLKTIYDSRGTVPVEGENDFVILMEKFFSFSQPSITSTNQIRSRCKDLLTSFKITINVKPLMQRLHHE